MDKPCNTCELNHRYCFTCEKKHKYDLYLISKRKYKKGKIIKSLNELLKTQWIWYCGRTMHIEVVKNWQLSMIIRILKTGYFYKAERKDGNDGKRDNDKK